MKFIAGNVEFTDNMKQLLPDLTIFDRIISNEPTILEDKLWRKQNGLTSAGIDSGSLENTTDSILYRSCYLLYKADDVISSSNIEITVTDIHSNEVVPDDEFNNWGLVKVDDNTYLLFIWIDIEQKYNINLTTGSFNLDDWYVQVVI